MIQETSIAFSGSIPMNYEKYLGPLFFEPFAKNISNRVKELQPSSVLELACGYRQTDKVFAFCNFSGRKNRCHGYQSGYAWICEAFLRDLEGIDWKVVDAVELPFRDSCFDVVVIQFGVMFFSDRHQAFTEALRVLKPEVHWFSLPGISCEIILSLVWRRIGYALFSDGHSWIL